MIRANINLCHVSRIPRYMQVLERFFLLVISAVIEHTVWCIETFAFTVSIGRSQYAKSQFNRLVKLAYYLDMSNRS